MEHRLLYRLYDTAPDGNTSPDESDSSRFSQLQSAFAKTAPTVRSLMQSFVVPFRTAMKSCQAQEVVLLRRRKLLEAELTLPKEKGMEAEQYRHELIQEVDELRTQIEQLRNLQGFLGAQRRVSDAAGTPPRL